MKDDKKIICPDCQAEIIMKGKKEVGDILECGECGTEVEILCLSPFKYEELFEEK